MKEKGWYCKKGVGIFAFDKNGLMQSLSRPNGKSSVIRIVTSRSFFKPLEAKIIKAIEKQHPVELVHFGSSLKQVELVLGSADMYLKAGLCSEWDTAPGQLMVEEFGGAVLQLQNFETMVYNKPEVLNPYFVMLNKRLNNLEFISFLKNFIEIEI